MTALAQQAATSSRRSSLRTAKGHAEDLATWLAVIQTATPLPAAFVPYLIERAKRGKITKITYGNWTVEGTATPADLADVRRQSR